MRLANFLPLIALGACTNPEVPQETKPKAEGVASYLPRICDGSQDTRPLSERTYADLFCKGSNKLQFEHYQELALDAGQSDQLSMLQSRVFCHPGQSFRTSDWANVDVTIPNDQLECDEGLVQLNFEKYGRGVRVAYIDQKIGQDERWIRSGQAYAAHGTMVLAQRFHCVLSKDDESQPDTICHLSRIEDSFEFPESLLFVSAQTVAQLQDEIFEDQIEPTSWSLYLNVVHNKDATRVFQE